MHPAAAICFSFGECALGWFWERWHHQQAVKAKEGSPSPKSGRRDPVILQRGPKAIVSHFGNISDPKKSINAYFFVILVRRRQVEALGME